MSASENLKNSNSPQTHSFQFIEKHSDATASAIEVKAITHNQTDAVESMTFERILNWIGNFTPQCKFQLMEIARCTSVTEFEAIAQSSFEVFRLAMHLLSQVPAGSKRAAALFQMIQHEQNQTAQNQTSCRKGCSACCRTFPKQITSDEGQLLAALLFEKDMTKEMSQLRLEAEGISQANTSKQISKSEQISAAAKPCVFLDSEGSCGVYEVRPSVCRKYHVTSPAEYCESSSSEPVVLKIDLIVELMTSAALSIPGNSRDFMQNQIVRHLPAKN